MHEAMEKLSSEMDRKFRAIKVLDVTDMSFDTKHGLEVVKINDQYVDLDGDSRNGLLHLSEKLGVPRSYTNRLLEEDGISLAESNLNYWAKKIGSRLRAIVLEGKVVEWLDKGFPVIPGVEWIKVVDKYSEGSALKEVYSAGPLTYDLAFTSYKMIVEPKRNDITETGVRTKFSEFGYVSPEIAPYINRLSCTNGAVFNECKTTFRVYGRDPSYILDRFAQSMKSAVEYITPISGFLTKMVETKVDSPYAAIARLASDSGLSAHLDQILLAFEQEPGDSLYDVHNAFTRAANGIQGVDRLRLQSLGGTIAVSVDTPRCVTCYSKLRSK